MPLKSRTFVDRGNVHLKTNQSVAQIANNGMRRQAASCHKRTETTEKVQDGMKMMPMGMSGADGGMAQ